MHITPISQPLLTLAPFRHDEWRCCGDTALLVSLGLRCRRDAQIDLPPTARMQGRRPQTASVCRKPPKWYRERQCSHTLPSITACCSQRASACGSSATKLTARVGPTLRDGATALRQHRQSVSHRLRRLNSASEAHSVPHSPGPSVHCWHGSWGHQHGHRAPSWPPGEQLCLPSSSAQALWVMSARMQNQSAAKTKSLTSVVLLDVELPQ